MTSHRGKAALRRAVAIAALTAGLIGATPDGAAKADTALGSVAVVVVSGPGAVAARDNFSVGLAPAPDRSAGPELGPLVEDTEVIEAVRRVSPVSTVRPAHMIVAGRPNQVFSVAFPTPSVVRRQRGEDIVFSDFFHSLGTTPSLGFDGDTVFAVGARIRVGSTDTVAGGAISATGTTGATDTTGTTAEDATPPSVVRMAPSDPFRFDTRDSPYLNILISYN